MGSSSVVVPLAIGVVAAILLILRESRTAEPLVDFGLLRRNRDYLGATISQALGGMVEMGTGVIFPLLLILNVEMSPSVAGLALVPLTLPMVIGAPLAGRWYDRAGGRQPLVAGFASMAAVPSASRCSTPSSTTRTSAICTSASTAARSPI